MVWNQTFFTLKNTLLLLSVFLSFGLLDAQTIQLHYSGDNEKIALAVTEANKILANPEFYKQIDAIPTFDNSSYSGLQVSTEIKDLNRTIEVKDYWKPWGFANAKTVSVVRIKTAKLKRSHASITNTVIHETVHAVDWWRNNLWDYTHDGNSPNGQNNTAPWIIGRLAENLTQ